MGLDGSPRWLVAGGVAAWVSLAVFGASADVAMPPPTDCPAGSAGDSCHAGPFCAPRSCAHRDFGECPSGSRCQPVALCVIEEGCGGRLVPGEPVDKWPKVVGLCDDEGGCAQGTCQRPYGCVAEESSGCAVSDRATPRTGLVGLALLFVLGLVAISRQTGRRSREPVLPGSEPPA